MFFALGFLAELLLLFFLSKVLLNLLFRYFYRISKNKKMSIYLMSLLFFPGTLIHELSHYIMAVLLQVPVGNMQLFPKVIDDGIKMGSVEIAKTDPIRRMLIGLGPFLFGSSLIVGIFYYATQYGLFEKPLFIIVAGYLVFEIGNTMFSSKKDMEGALELLVAIIFLVVVFYLVGFRLPALNPETIFSNKVIVQTFKKAALYLTAPIGIDLILIMFLKLFRY